MSYNDIIIIDNGESTMRVGTSLSPVPLFTIQNSVHLPSPFYKGAIINPDSMVSLWNRSLRELSTDPKDKRLLLTNSIYTTMTERELMAESAFETCGVGSLYLVNRAILALYMEGVVSGVVVHSGTEDTYAVPVVDGITIYNGVRSVGVGGRDVEREMERMMRERGVYVPEENRTGVIRNIKEELGFLKTKTDTNTKTKTKVKTNKKDPSVSGYYELPDKKIIAIKQEAYLCPELVFNPLLFRPTVADNGGNTSIGTSIENKNTLVQSLSTSLYTPLVKPTGASQTLNSQLGVGVGESVGESGGSTSNKDTSSIDTSGKKTGTKKKEARLENKSIFSESNGSPSEGTDGTRVSRSGKSTSINIDSGDINSGNIEIDERREREREIDALRKRERGDRDRGIGECVMDAWDIFLKATDKQASREREKEGERGKESRKAKKRGKGGRETTIVLTGGNSMIEGMPLRLLESINTHITTNTNTNTNTNSDTNANSKAETNTRSYPGVNYPGVKILANPERYRGSFIGAYHLVNLPAFEECWISKTQYEEEGKSAVRRGWS